MAVATGKTTGISTRWKLVISALMLLVLALGFNVMLSLSSLEKLYVESVVSKYKVIGKDLQRSLEKSLRFGKNIKKFIGIEKLLIKTRHNLGRRVDLTGQTLPQSVSESDITVSVSTPNGTILYSTENKLKHTKLPQNVQVDYQYPGNEKNQPSDYIKHKDTYIITIPVYGGFKKKWAATIVIAFNEKQVKELLNHVLFKNFQLIAVILLCGTVLLIILLNVVVKPSAQKFPKFKISLIMFLVIGFSQIIFTGLNTYGFRNYYLQISKEKTALLATMLKEDIEFFLSKGLRINKLVKMDVMMGEIIAAAPELDNITITDNLGNPLYTATKKKVVDYQKMSEEERQKITQEFENVEDPRYNFLLKLLKDKKVEGYISADSYKGFISTNISKKVLFAKLKEIALDSATVLIVSILFFVEMLILTFQFIERQFANAEQKLQVSYQLARPVAFSLLFAVAISASFLPLHMENIYKPLFGLSKDIVIGLPISAEMFFTLLVLFPCATWMDKKGWHEPFLFGIAVTATALFFSGTAKGPLEFILYRGLLGVGYGAAWMSIQGFVIANTKATEQARGMSNLVAGIFSGSICAGVVGAMLAERIGYTYVFFVGAGLMFLPFFFIVVFMRDFFIKPAKIFLAQQEKVGIGKFLRFFFDRNIFSAFTFSIIPKSICVVGILYYINPIYLSRIGTSQSNIGRTFMVYGLCMIYIAPIVSKFIDRSENKKKFIILSGIFSSLGLGFFYIYSGLYAIVFLILMLGMASSFGSASEMVYVLNSKAAYEIGRGRVMSVQRTADKIGQMLGPITMGLVAGTVGIEKGIAAIGIIYLVMIVLFIIVTRKEKPYHLSR